MPRRPKGLIVPDGKSATSGNPKRCALQAIIDGVRPLVPSETRLRADVPPIFGNVDRDQHDDVPTLPRGDGRRPSWRWSLSDGQP